MGLVLGRAIKVVSLTARHTKFEAARLEALLTSPVALSDSDQLFLLDESKIAMAGYLGEVVALGDAHPKSADSDLPEANRILKRIGSRQGSGMGLQDEVMAILTEHIDSLKRIAVALLAEKELSSERVAELMAEPGPTPNPSDP
jgi:hypothetical protein